MSQNNEGKVRVGRYRWVVVATLVFMGMTALFDRGNIILANPVIAKEFELTAVAVGFMLSAVTWGLVVTQIPAGTIAGFKSAKWVLVVCSFGWSIGTVLCGLAQDSNQLIACRVLIGLSEGALAPTTMIFVVRWFPLKERATATGLVYAGGGLAGVVGAPLTGFLILNSGWRNMFFIEGALALIGTLAMWVLLGDDPRTHGRVGEAEREWIVGDTDAQQQAQGGPAGARWHEALKHPMIWAIIIALAIYSGSSTAFNSWAPTGLNQSYGIDVQSLGLLAMIPALLAIIMPLVNGRLSDHFGRRDLFVLWPLIGGFLGFAFAMVTADPFTKIIAMVLALGVASGANALYVAWLSDLVPKNLVGITVAIGYVFTQLGIIAMTIGIGYVAAGSGVLGGALLVVVPSYFVCILGVFAFMIVRGRQVTVRPIAT